jgi:prolyl-tRNA synthetase
LLNVNPGRDFTVETFADLRNAQAGDLCPRCSGTLQISNAIEGGHVFKLGTKYSQALGAKFLDADETQKTIIMGCYGIGINRILVGICETSYDESGIIWSVPLAPYEAVITPLKIDDELTMNAAKELYRQLNNAGIDCLLDDRDQRPGVKFKDADLIGFPMRIVLGPKGLAKGEAEIKWRWDKDAIMIPLSNAAEQIAAVLNEERKTNKLFLKHK